MLGSRASRRVVIEGSDILLPTDIQATLAVVIAYTKNPLAANASYESEWVDVQTESRIVYLVNTDADGMLKIQHSIDGSEVDYEDTIAITGGTPCSGRRMRRGFYAKVVYENGAVAQTKFRLLVTAVSWGV